MAASFRGGFLCAKIRRFVWFVSFLTVFFAIFQAILSLFAYFIMVFWEGTQFVYAMV